VLNCSPNDEGLFILNPGFGGDVTRDLLLMSQALGFQITDTTYTGLTGGPCRPRCCALHKSVTFSRHGRLPDWRLPGATLLRITVRREEELCPTKLSKETV